MSLEGDERESALAELTAYSGILKLDQLLDQTRKEFPMLIYDLKDHAMIRTLMEEAKRDGERDLIRLQLAEKFGGPLPKWGDERIEQASPEDLARWGRRIVKRSSLEDTLQ